MKYLKLLWNFWRLRGNTKKSSSEIAHIQEQKLRKLLRYAFDHSVYYHKRFAECGITEEQLGTLPLSAFPTIDKADFLENFDELVTVPELRQEELRRFDQAETEHQKIFMDKYHVVHSSGSTGKPGYFVYEEAAWNQMLLGIIRGALWGMTVPQMIQLLAKPRIVYIAATDGRYGGAMAASAGIDALHAKQLFLDINTPLAQWISSVQDFRPNIIIGYPSAIKILGELMASGEIEADMLRVISCGEPLGANLRSFFEKTFHAPVVNLYGASESLAMGVEISRAQGMILFDDMNIIEVENGSMYLTSLYHFAQPLIRYKISDQLVLKQADERCPFTKAEMILGRSEDMLWFEDGIGGRDFLHPLALEGFCIEGLLDFQFRQMGADCLEMLAEVTNSDRKDSIEAELLRQVNTILWEKKLGSVKLSVRFVERILPDPRTGKKPLIVRAEQESVA